MFLFNGVIFLTNIFLINYNFIELYENFIIYFSIPYINYIYKLRGQNKMIDIIVYDNFNKVMVNSKYSDSEEYSDSGDININKFNNQFPDESDSNLNLKNNNKFNNKFHSDSDSESGSDLNLKNNNKFKYNNNYTKKNMIVNFYVKMIAILVQR